jgi:hypothetical protein
MERRSEGFHITVRQRWMIAIMIVIWVVYLFWPGIAWLTNVVGRPSPFRTRRLVATIPWTWEVISSDSIITARRPCLNVFCSPATTKISIALATRTEDFADIWHNSVISELKGRGFSVPVERTFESPIGPFHCLEATSPTLSHVANSYCFSSTLDWQAGFEGRKTDLNNFYRMIESCHRR